MIMFNIANRLVIDPKCSNGVVAMDAEHCRIAAGLPTTGAPCAHSMDSQKNATTTGSADDNTRCLRRIYYTELLGKTTKITNAALYF